MEAGIALAMEIEHVDVVHGDIEYMYYIWQDHGKEIWMSIFEVNGSYRETCQHCDSEIVIEDECIFVGKPEKLIWFSNTN